MHPETPHLTSAIHRRLLLRRIRLGTLLVCLLASAIWGFEMWRADHRVFAWTKPVNVLVLALVDPETRLGSDELQELFHGFLSSPRSLDGNLAGVAKWLEDERAVLSAGEGRVVDFSCAGPFTMTAAPPLPPPAEASFLERWSTTRSFLGYFEDVAEKLDVARDGYDVTIFVYFFAEERASIYGKQHSMASRRDGFGVVFAPLGRKHLPYSAALLAHELLHTFGATDKYEGAKCIYPDGFAEPDLAPLYPQRWSEIMALGIPIEPGRERRVTALSDCKVGRKTAAEIGWVHP